MRRKLILIILIGLLALLPATANAKSRCTLTGKGKNIVCICPNSKGMFRGAPMWRCK